MAEHHSVDVSPSFAALRRAAIVAARVVGDHTNLWTVYELPPADYDRRRTATLIFESEFSMHRFRDYPADWRSLPDVALLRMVS